MIRGSAGIWSTTRLPPPWWVSQTITSSAPAASAAAQAEFTSAISRPRPWAATWGRAPGSQYQHCSRVNSPLTPSMSQSM